MSFITEGVRLPHKFKVVLKKRRDGVQLPLLPLSLSLLDIATGEVISNVMIEIVREFVDVLVIVCNEGVIFATRRVRGSLGVGTTDLGVTLLNRQ